MSAPYFLTSFRGTRQKQGKNATFSAVVSGFPEPDVMWYREGNQIKPSDKYIMYYDPQTGEIELTLTCLGPGDEGDYTCKVWNAYGEVNVTLTIAPEENRHQRCLSPHCSRVALQRS